MTDDDQSTGGTWESLGRLWNEDSDAGSIECHTSERNPVVGVIHGPKGEVVRVVRARKSQAFGFGKCQS
jgi:hypothetical protein